MATTSRIADKNIAYKVTDQLVASSTTLVDDDYLRFPINGNEIWQFKFIVLVVSTSTPDFKLSIGGPGTPDNLRAHIYVTNGTGSGFSNGDIITAYDTEVTLSVATSIDNAAFIFGTVENGSTAGDVVLRWAQRLVNATPTRVKRGSYVVSRRIQ